MCAKEKTKVGESKREFRFVHKILPRLTIERVGEERTNRESGRGTSNMWLGDRRSMLCWLWKPRV